MLGLILGTSLILNRKIVTDGRLTPLIPTVLAIFSPILFGIDGKYGLFDGIAMIGLYVGLIFYLYRLNSFGNQKHIEITDSDRIGKSIVLAIVGIAGILIASHWIVDITLDLLDYIRVSRLTIGLIVFSIGTNLPEISIAVTSWRRKSAELSLSHLLSSSFTNVLVLGVLTLLRPIAFETGLAFWTVALFLGIILILFAYFYHSGKKNGQARGRYLACGLRAVYGIELISDKCNLKIPLRRAGFFYTKHYSAVTGGATALITLPVVKSL